MKKIKIILSLIGIVLIFNLVAMETEAENIGVERRDFLQEVVIDSTYVLNENDEYHANTVMVIERGGHLVINADIVFKNDCIIDARCGKITINGGGKLSLGKNTLLMLSRYPLEGSGTLYGDFARVDAPVKRIFDATVEIKGNWSVDRAYPQWFAPAGTDDWSGPINKAIEFMRCGEVFLPRGLYPIKGTIFVKTGIHLVGASGNSVGGYVGKKEVDSAINFCSVIQACDDANNSFETAGLSEGDDLPEEYNCKQLMIMVNAEAADDSIDWVSQYPTQGTVVRDICVSVDPRMYKLYDPDDDAAYVSPVNMCGIFFSGAAEFRNVAFYQCYQAIVSDDDAYSDLKKVVGCAYNGIEEDADCGAYVFDLSGLGDGLIFSHNIVGSRDNALKLDKCMGGKIFSNIFRGVYLHNCRGITFESNHMEENPQVEIVKSLVSVKNNYMEVGNRPSIYIRSGKMDDVNEYDRSVVEIGGNCHNFVDGDRFADKYYKGSVRDRLEDVCEYDVQIDRNSVVRIDNEYRYRTFVDLPHLSYPQGIKMSNGGIYEERTDKEGKTETVLVGYTPFGDFNERSHLLSEKCNIRPDFVIEGRSDEPGSTGGITYHMANEWVEWAYGEGGGKYKYACQFYKDGVPVGAPVSCMPAGKPYFEPVVGARGYAYGAMLYVWGLDNVGKYAMVRLLRENENTGQSWYVDVPLAGSRNLYDNGVSVAGFKWIETTNNK